MLTLTIIVAKTNMVTICTLTITLRIFGGVISAMKANVTVSTPTEAVNTIRLKATNGTQLNTLVS